MLLVKTSVRESKVHGLGLFAEEYIPKGTRVCQFLPGFDQRFTAEEILKLPKQAQIYLTKYALKSDKSKLYCFPSDNDRYTNHSDDPNVLSEYLEEVEEFVTTAIRDIEPGEEILDNYASFESDLEEDNILTDLIKSLHLEDELDPRLKQLGLAV